MNPVDNFLSILSNVPPAAREPHGLNNCTNPYCPAKVKYDEIVYRGEDGAMFSIRNVLVWIPADELSFDSDEKVVDMCLGEATHREFV